MVSSAEFLLLLLAGGLPYGTGALLAGSSGYLLRPEVWGPGLAGTLLLIGAAVCSREAWAPGCGRTPGWGILSPGRWKLLGWLCLGLAAGCGLFLQAGAGTGAFTLPLGFVGMLAGFGFFAPPLAWRGRGSREAVGALAFGLLPVLTGYYLLCGHLITEILVYGLALSFAAFNVFQAYGMLLPANGLPVARRRPATWGLVYTLVNILLILGLVFILVFPAAPLPTRGGLLALMGLSLVNQELVKRRAYARPDLLPWLVAGSVAQHLGMGLVFAAGLFWRGW
jgi:hypothetical protein